MSKERMRLDIFILKKGHHICKKLMEMINFYQQMYLIYMWNETEWEGVEIFS